MTEREVQVTKDVLKKILSCVTGNAVLIGGQALALWVFHYDIDLTLSSLSRAISNDVDFLGGRDDVTAIARGVPGLSEFPHQRAITSLVGLVKIRVAPNEFVNVDVLHKLIGIQANTVKARAFKVTLGETVYLLMHPLDVLQSRVENLAALSSKQNAEGIEQTRLAVLVAHEYILELAATPESERPVLNAIERVASIAKSAAGVKAARQFGVAFLPGIPAYVVRNESFNTIRWPLLCEELEAAAGQNQIWRSPDQGDAP